MGSGWALCLTSAKGMLANTVQGPKSPVTELCRLFLLLVTEPCQCKQQLEPQGVPAHKPWEESGPWESQLIRAAPQVAEMSHSTCWPSES